jgi:putative membrane protein insertion efficiency factor
VLSRAMIAAIRFYRKGISPLKPPVCRFTPTCSAYGLEAVERYGAARGSGLLIKRLARCQPFSKGGYDPVP